MIFVYKVNYGEGLYWLVYGVLQDPYNINHVRSKVSMANYAISKVKYIFPENVKVHIYNSLVQSYLGYGLEAWGELWSPNLNLFL